MTATEAPDYYVVEHFDGWTPRDPEVAKHLDFARTMDAIARTHGERDYVLPWSCPGCLRIVAAFEADHQPAPAPDTAGAQRGALTTTGEGGQLPAARNGAEAPGAHRTPGSGPSLRERAPHPPVVESGE
jgi:hypothetical protein